MSRDGAVGRIGKPPLPKRRLRAVRLRPRIACGKEPVQQHTLDLGPRHCRRLRVGNHPRPATGKRDGKPLIRRTGPCQRALLEFARGGNEMFPLRAGKLASPGKPRFDEVCDGKVDVVAAQEDMLAHSHAPDVGDRAWLVQVQLEQTEIRSTAADIDDQRVPWPGLTIVEWAPQLMSRIVSLKPAIERSLWLLEQPHAAREAR